MAVFEDLLHYVGFESPDAARIQALAPFARPLFPHMVERFYAEIIRHPGAAAVFSSPEQIGRLRHKLAEWLDSLFVGVYDDAYLRRHSEIGRVHVRVGMDQHFMFGAMEIIWQEFESGLRASGAPDVEGGLRSLHKLLSVELGIMLETYKESYAQWVRERERISLQDRLSRAEHLASVGQLAASLAHEIKNPLAGISGAIQVIRDGMAGDDDRRPILSEVLRQIDRLDGTVRDLLFYARPKPPDFSPCDLNQLTLHVLAALRAEPQLGRVRVEFLEASPTPEVLADEHQMEQLLINLLLNAAQASPEGGAVELRLRCDEKHVHLEVRDHGHGMSDDVRRRALEPFFTTKSKGTGLGLPICLQIVSVHGGALHIRSAPGAGTSVFVQLPAKPSHEGNAA